MLSRPKMFRIKSFPLAANSTTYTRQVLTRPGIGVLSQLRKCAMLDPPLIMASKIIGSLTVFSFRKVF